MNRIAIVGAGVSGLTCGVLLAEAGKQVTIFAEETGAQTTSAAAGAIWFPYDVEPRERVVGWSLQTFETLLRLTSEVASGVSMIELRCLSRAGEIEVPAWAPQLGACRLQELPPQFTSGFAVEVPLIDTSVYLRYLHERFTRAGGEIRSGFRVTRLQELLPDWDTLINCAGVGARELVGDGNVEPHRGQVVFVAKPELEYAIVCNDPPLMYIFPRAHDCVCGGTNTVSDNRQPSAADRASILQECTRVLGTAAPPVLGERVGLRPFRKGGVRLERERVSDGRLAVHNYGHGGAGFTLSWGCAEEVAQLLRLG
ncbi:MAG: FAD-binding oxidoreductase [Verrucomicrobiota bacterium]|nr:FAD-binding oxidoreductase [Verrucomicrobiota bacterium]